MESQSLSTELVIGLIFVTLFLVPFYLSARSVTPERKRKVGDVTFTVLFVACIACGILELGSYSGLSFVLILLLFMRDAHKAGILRKKREREERKERLVHPAVEILREFESKNSRTLNALTSLSPEEYEGLIKTLRKSQRWYARYQYEEALESAFKRYRGLEKGPKE
jgi:hypothetical protein